MTEASERAVRAQQLLDDELLIECLAKLENDALEVARVADMTDPNIAVAALSYLRAAYEIRPRLQSIINTGKIEAKPKLYRA